MNSIFDLFNFDLNDLAKKLDELKVLATDKYNDFVNNNLKKYDVTTDEGYQAFINEAAEIRKQLEGYDGVFSQKLIDMLDKFVEDASRKHAEANANKVKKDINANRNIDNLVHAEVVRNVKENHGRINTSKGVEEDSEESTIDYPSDKLSGKQKRNVWKLVDEYMDTKVIPFIPDEDYDEDLVDDMSSGLFEFAAWILTKEED